MKNISEKIPFYHTFIHGETVELHVHVIRVRNNLISLHRTFTISHKVVSHKVVLYGRAKEGAPYFHIPLCLIF